MPVDGDPFVPAEPVCRRVIAYFQNLETLVAHPRNLLETGLIEAGSISQKGI